MRRCNGWDDIIYNHCAVRVPGEPSKFLMKQHELLWDEVTASNLVKVDMNEDLDEKGRRQSSRLHVAQRRACAPAPTSNCSIHIHTETGMALSGLKNGLRMVSQQAMRFYKRIGYHPMRASLKISPSASASQCASRHESRADPQQPRSADGRQDGAREPTFSCGT